MYGANSQDLNPSIQHMQQVIVGKHKVLELLVTTLR